MRQLIFCLAALALAACQASEKPQAPPPEPAPPTLDSGPPAAAPLFAAEPQRELCPALAGVIATESDGFAKLRASQIGAASWLGRDTLPGTERCTIEGEAWPRARYACASESYQAGGRDGADARFDALARAIDRCLSQPIWFPRDWQKGAPFQFAMGERLQTWTDQSTQPPFQVVLRMQQDIDRRSYQLRLDLESVR